MRWWCCLILAMPTVACAQDTAAIACAVRRVCVVGIDSSERIVGTTTGDSERWPVTTLSHVVALKPTECGIASDLVIVTDRRVYTVALTSAPCGSHGPVQITPYVRFSHPDTVATPPANGASTLAFTYHWTHDPHIAWTPVAVYDDGVRTTIRFPATASRVAAPVLFEESGDGDRVMVNYRAEGDAYVADRVFARAVLEAADGKRVRRVEIVNDRLWPGAK
jgi:type IV secretion system protein TrbG